MFRTVWLSVFCCVLFTLPALAQEKPLKLSIRREWEGARSSAPLSLRAYAKWQRSELLEGRLQVDAFVDTPRISHWTSNEISLSDSEQYVWLMSPRPMMTHTSRYVLRSELLSPTFRQEHDDLDVDVPVRSRRVMVVALIGEHGVSVPAGLGSVGPPTAFEHAMSLHDYVTARDAADLHLHLSRVEPKDFPGEPLRLLGLDAVMVPHDMLGRLKPAQLESLQQWLFAGGSMLLIRTGKLTESADEWLRDTTHCSWSRAQMQARELPDNVMVNDVGLGQLLVLDRGLDGESPAWQRTACQLLRLRPERTNEIVLDRKLRISPDPLKSEDNWSSLEPRGRVYLEDRSGHGNLQQLLMPESIRGMPFWLAASVLGLCLLFVGPADYWLLGALKRRRWTWVLFPLVALLFTGWMAQLAADHNGNNDSRRWLSIVDVTPSGEVLRTTRLELTYGASARVVSHEVKHQWWCDLRSNDLRSIYQSDLSLEAEPRLEYSGAVPSNYVVSEPVRQWAPRMQRITTLGADPELASLTLPQVDWSSLGAASGKDPITPAKLEKLSPAISRRYPNALWAMTTPGDGIRWNSTFEDTAVDARLQAIAATVLPELLTARGENERNIFFLQTELSPTAGPDCEDLVLSSRRAGLILQEVEPGKYLVTRTIFPTVE